MNEKQKLALRHFVGGKLNDIEFADMVNYIETYLMRPPTLSEDIKRIVHLNGKVVRPGAEVVIAFKVADKLYPATELNCDLMDTYLHTGDKVYLDQLENEVGF